MHLYWQCVKSLVYERVYFHRWADDSLGGTKALITNNIGTILKYTQNENLNSKTRLAIILSNHLQYCRLIVQYLWRISGFQYSPA